MYFYFSEYTIMPDLLSFGLCNKLASQETRKELIELLLSIRAIDER